MLDVSAYFFLYFPINFFVLKTDVRAACEKCTLQHVEGSGKIRALRLVISIYLRDSFVPQITSFIVRTQSLRQNGDECLTEVRSFKSAASIIINFFAFRLGEFETLCVTCQLSVQLKNTSSSASPELPIKFTYTNKNQPNLTSNQASTRGVAIK